MASPSPLTPSPVLHGPFVHRLVLTGGPCAGKTTALARVATFLRKRGFVVLTVPEVATLLFGNGAGCAAPLAVQREIYTLQCSLEEAFLRIATQASTGGSGASRAGEGGGGGRRDGSGGGASGGNGRASTVPTTATAADTHVAGRVLLCDRGVMDGSAYVPADWFARMLAADGLTLADVREKRYEAVFHLETAAKGAEEFYTTENNALRRESAAEARQMDDLVMQAWVGHPQLTSIGNFRTFEEKLMVLERAVARVVGLPSDWQSTVRFLLRCAPVGGIPLPCVQEFLCDKVYLKTDHWAQLRAWVRHHPARDRQVGKLYPYAFVRRSVPVVLGVPQESSASFTFSRGDIAADGQLIEETRIVSEREYATLVSAQASSAHHVVRQRRWSFLWRGHFYEVKAALHPFEGLAMVSCQSAHHCTSAGSKSGDDIQRGIGAGLQRSSAAATKVPSKAAAKEAAAETTAAGMAATTTSTVLRTATESETQGSLPMHASDAAVQVVDGVELPSFLEVDKNITDNPGYFMYTLARVSTMKEENSMEGEEDEGDSDTGNVDTVARPRAGRGGEEL